MRVTFSSFYRNGIDDINRAAEDLARRQREVSSLRRVHVPSDDPSAMTEIIGERSAMRGYDQYVEATDSVDARLRVADSALTDLIKNLTSAQTTLSAARNSYITAEQREAFALQLEGIRDAALSDANVEYRGTYLFAGTASRTTPFEKDPGTGLVRDYAGDTGAAAIQVDANREVPVSFDGGAAFGDLFAALQSAIDAVRASDVAGMAEGFDRVSAAFQRVTNVQSRIGNSLSGLEDHRTRLNDARTAADTRRSGLEDANLAEAITRMQQADGAHRAALGAVSSASRLSLLDYLQ